MCFAQISLFVVSVIGAVDLVDCFIEENSSLPQEIKKIVINMIVKFKTFTDSLSALIKKS